MLEGFRIRVVSPYTVNPYTIKGLDRPGIAPGIAPVVFAKIKIISLGLSIELIP
jgi:hypothetical protein